jgi:hypothetical protein
MSSVQQESNSERVARFYSSLSQLIDRIADDRYVLAVALVGSLTEETIWRRDSIGLWIIEADGVTLGLASILAEVLYNQGLIAVTFLASMLLVGLTVLT